MATGMKKSFAIWIAVILFSVVTGLSAASVLVSRGDISDFYKSGEVWVIPSSQIALTSWNVQYDRDSNVFTITDEQAQMTLSSNMKKKKWKYLEVSVSHFVGETLTMDFQYYKRNGNPAGTQTVELKEGFNEIKLTAKKFSYIVADMRDQAGISFSMDRFRLMTKRDHISRRRLLALCLAFFLICLVLSGTAVWFLRRTSVTTILYMPVVGLQRLYIWCGERIPQRILDMHPKQKGRLRVLVLAILFLSLTVLNVYGIFLKYAYHVYVMLFLCALLFLLAVLSADRGLRLQNWKNPLTASWLVLWCMACISDLVVGKKGPFFSFYGYIMIILMGFLFFLWNQKGMRLVLWRDICHAAEITFYVAVVFCLLCRPEKEGFRYNGPYINPNPFGLYLAVIACVFLCELEWYILEKHKNRVWFIICCCSMAALVFFLKKTQCTTGTLALAAVIFFWLAGHLGRRFLAPCKRRLACALLLTAALYLPVSAGLDWGIRTLPEVFHTTVSYPEEMDYAKGEEAPLFAGETVYALESGAPTGQESYSEYRVIEKLFSSRTIDSFLTGRGNNFTAYLKDMNLFGHKKKPMVYGASTRYAHNGLLAYAHTYGVYAAVPYIVMNLYFLYYAFLYWRKGRGRNAFSYLPLSVGLVFFLENMMDNVDIPFHWIVWFLFLFMEGSFFNFRDSSIPQDTRGRR